jgi:hypothetical protein
VCTAAIGIAQGAHCHIEVYREGKPLERAEWEALLCKPPPKPAT